MILLFTFLKTKRTKYVNKKENIVEIKTDIVINIIVSLYRVKISGKIDRSTPLTAYVIVCGSSSDKKTLCILSKNAKKLKEISRKSVGNALTQIITKIDIRTSVISPVVFFSNRIKPSPFLPFSGYNL